MPNRMRGISKHNRNKKLQIMKSCLSISSSKKFPGTQIHTILMLLLLFFSLGWIKLQSDKLKHRMTLKTMALSLLASSWNWHWKIIVHCSYMTRRTCSRPFLDIFLKLKEALCFYVFWTGTTYSAMTSAICSCMWVT